MLLYYNLLNYFLQLIDPPGHTLSRNLIHKLHIATYNYLDYVSFKLLNLSEMLLFYNVNVTAVL